MVRRVHGCSRCEDCGTSIQFLSDGAESLPSATLDDPNAFLSTEHDGVESQLHGLKFADDLPRQEYDEDYLDRRKTMGGKSLTGRRQRPPTKGLGLRTPLTGTLPTDRANDALDDLSPQRTEGLFSRFQEIPW